MNKTGILLLIILLSAVPVSSLPDKQIDAEHINILEEIQQNAIIRSPFELQSKIMENYTLLESYRYNETDYLYQSDELSTPIYNPISLDLMIYNQKIYVLSSNMDTGIILSERDLENPDLIIDEHSFQLDNFNLSEITFLKLVRYMGYWNIAYSIDSRSYWFSFHDNSTNLISDEKIIMDLVVYTYNGSDASYNSEIVDLLIADELGTQPAVMRITTIEGQMEVIDLNLDIPFCKCTTKYLQIIENKMIIIGELREGIEYDLYLLSYTNRYIWPRYHSFQTISLVGDQFLLGTELLQDTKFSVDRGGKTLMIYGYQYLERTDRGLVEMGLLLELVVTPDNYRLLQYHYSHIEGLPSRIIAVQNPYHDLLSMIYQVEKNEGFDYYEVIYRYNIVLNTDLQRISRIDEYRDDLRRQTLLIGSLTALLILPLLILFYDQKRREDFIKIVRKFQEELKFG